MLLTASVITLKAVNPLQLSAAGRNCLWIDERPGRRNKPIKVLKFSDGTQFWTIFHKYRPSESWCKNSRWYFCLIVIFDGEQPLCYKRNAHCEVKAKKLKVINNWLIVGNCSKCCWKVLNTHECRAEDSSKWLKWNTHDSLFPYRESCVFHFSHFELNNWLLSDEKAKILLFWKIVKI